MNFNDRDDKRINLESGEQLDKQLLAEQEAVYREQQEKSSLIEFSGAEVGDEERDRLIEAVKRYFPYCMTFDANLKDIRKDTKERIIAILRQPKRTVSRKYIDRVARDIVACAENEGVSCAERLEEAVTELGFTIEEPKKEGEEKP